MNYYERIQKSIEYLEANLENEIDLNIAAKEAYMSTSNYYRMFFALVGYTVKEYIRLRRISAAASEIIQTDTALIDIAIKYDFGSSDSFSRAFKRITGFVPSVFRKKELYYTFERVNILEKYYDNQDKELIERYPDIKILKKLEKMRVAYYCYYGVNPEKEAFKVIADWLKRSGLNFEKDKLRIFGFNNPSPINLEQKEYGYEVWVTIDENTEIIDKHVKAKLVDGGMYAVCGVKNLVPGDEGIVIPEAWQKLNNWLIDSKYTFGEHKWLEEHLHFNDEFEHFQGMDLYMPIRPKGTAVEKDI